ncbi:MAG: hypothetical protein K6G71_03570 [Clostridiales bacterium]|nr:hypothetical protein [Clostridiales bacterium]
MNGWLIALIVIASVILFFVLLLSIRISFTVCYTDRWTATANWLFLKLDLIPLDEKLTKLINKIKQKKAKKPPEEAPAEAAEGAQEAAAQEAPEQTGEAAAQETPEGSAAEAPAAPAKKKDSLAPLRNFYNNKGVDGVVGLLGRVVSDLGGMFGALVRKVIIAEFFLDMKVHGADAADTAVKYGKLCDKIFPAVGFMCSEMKVRRYNVDVSPDFLANSDEIDFRMKGSVIPRAAINAVIALVFRLLFGVLLKFIIGAMPSSGSKGKTAEKAPAPDAPAKSAAPDAPETPAK